MKNEKSTLLIANKIRNKYNKKRSRAKLTYENRLNKIKLEERSEIDKICKHETRFLRYTSDAYHSYEIEVCEKCETEILKTRTDYEYDG